MTTKIAIKGTIVSNDDKVIYDWYGMESTAPKDIQLPTDGSDVLVEINSTGGDVWSGAEIYSALRSYAGKVNVEIVGLAASAASFIAMAGDHISISPMGQMMIHNASTYTYGNGDKLRKNAEILDKTSSQIADSYAERTGRPVNEFVELMAKETWFTAQEAVDNGLADDVMYQEQPSVQLVAGMGILPQEAKDKALEAIANEKKQADSIDEELADSIDVEVETVEQPAEKVENEKPKLFIL